MIMDLIMSIKKKRHEDTKALLDRNEDLKNTKYKGLTPLMWAAKKGNLKACKLLVRKGANLEIKDDDGETALYKACDEEHDEIVEFLLDEGAKINTKDKLDRTPLHIAVENERERMVELLLEREAKLNLVDAHGSSPLSLALDNGSDDIADLLREKGARNVKRHMKEDKIDSFIDRMKRKIEQDTGIPIGIPPYLPIAQPHVPRNRAAFLAAPRGQAVAARATSGYDEHSFFAENTRNRGPSQTSDSQPQQPGKRPRTESSQTSRAPKR